MDYIIIALLTLLTLKQFKYLKDLQLSTAKTFFDIIIIIFMLVVLSFLMYRYASTLSHYLAGTIGMVLFIVMSIKEGVTDKGFVSLYRYKEFIPWNEIENVDIKKGKYIKITLFGKFMEQSFKFNRKDYDKLMEIMKDKLYKQNT